MLLMLLRYIIMVMFADDVVVVEYRIQYRCAARGGARAVDAYLPLMFRRLRFAMPLRCRHIDVAMLSA